ncbi:MAG: GTP-binding protein [Candidatus Accumulibacter sp.]|jgi:G3E family GTPase|nr:GTP-binding protein [Accumulibacter sp.]
MGFNPEITLVSGFLGAGKTTLIRRLLSGVIPAEETVVLENEFGAVDVDGELLRSRGALVVSVRAGCICCTGAGDFLSAISEIREKFSPKRILIEPTGLAKLSELIARFKTSPLGEVCDLKSVVTVVNAAGFGKRMSISRDFFEDQIGNSGLILLSRAEKLPPGDVTEIERHILSIRPSCRVVSDEWEKLPAKRLSALLDFARPAEPQTEKYRADIHDIHSSSWSDAIPRAEAFVSRFAAALEDGEFGGALRVKGWILFQDGMVRAVDYTPGEFIIGETVSKRATEFCFIGKNLNGRKLREFFE